MLAAMIPALALSLVAVAPVSAMPVDPCDRWPDTCAPPPPPDPPPAPVYTLQGVIQNEGIDSDPNGVPHAKRVNIRGYTRFADASNNRVDTDYINVRCYATDQLGQQTTDYDSENNGSLVDVHFASPWVYGEFRVITVTCTHTGRRGSTDYNTTSTVQITIPY
jgi:hypothetical protein